MKTNVKWIKIRTFATCIEMIDGGEFIDGILPVKAVERLKKECIIDIIDLGTHFSLPYLLSSSISIAFPLLNEEWYNMTHFYYQKVSGE